MEMEPDNHVPSTPAPVEHLASDVIVIRKSWLIAASIGVIFFIIGGLSGYLLGTFAYSRGQADSIGTVAVAQAPAPAPAQAQPHTQGQAAAPAAARIDDISVDDDPFLGPEDAPVTIVEFSDFQCPFCSRFHQQTFEPLLEQYGDQIRFVYRDFPITQLHSQAQEASEAAECANAQDGYWEYHNLLFNNQQSLGRDNLIGFAEELGLDVAAFTECVDSGSTRDEVLADLDEGRSYGVTGTPTFFINGVRIVGAQPLTAFQAIIDSELDS